MKECLENSSIIKFACKSFAKKKHKALKSIQKLKAMLWLMKNIPKHFKP